ncbi:TatD family hydrolase [Alicyclobacillus tolerans]|uniref:TatD family hydrolase n=1 Tax=Alicyclobacillus tolerans TaxID=90970 RepID=UPI003B7DFAC7
MLFDTHCHLMDDRFREDLPHVIERARAVGVTEIVVPGVDVESSRKALEIAEAYSGVYAAVGIHPEAVGRVSDDDYAAIETMAAHPRVVAIGEIGLDYYWDAAPRDVQRAAFVRQIEMARRLQLPVIVHNRESTGDVLQCLQEAHVEEVGGIMHCFNGSEETAKICLAMGMYLSFGGSITFKNARNVQAVASTVPRDRLLVETDAPYLTPHPHRGTRNEPAYVQLVAQRLAQAQGISYEQICDYTRANALRLFMKIGEGEGQRHG